jgi:hypothetical protein
MTAKCLRFIVMSSTSRMALSRRSEADRTAGVTLSLQQKIQRLKESVGSRETDGRGRLASSSITLQLAGYHSLLPHSPLRSKKSMRLIAEKEATIESGPNHIKDLLAALDKKELPSPAQQPRNNEKEREEERVERLRRESELLQVKMSRKQTELLLKNESLKTLKQQLLAKVQLSNSYIRTQKQPPQQAARPLKRSKSSVPAANGSIQLAIAREKNHHREEEKELKDKQREAQMMSLEALKQLREEEKQRERLNQQLKIKREKVDRLKEQISSPPKSQQPDPTLELEAIKRRK